MTCSQMFSLLLITLHSKSCEYLLGSNALHWAVDGGRATAVEWLLVNGAEVSQLCMEMFINIPEESSVHPISYLLFGSTRYNCTS